MAVIDYARMQRDFPKQKAALTRAVNAWKRTGDNTAVIETCRKTVRVWDEVGCWPDDWARWQRALSDTLPWHSDMDLRDL